MIEIMKFASCHLREVVYNNSLIRLTVFRVSSRCPVMIEDRKRWGFERLSIRTGNSRQVGRFDTLGEPICPGRTCTGSRTAGKSVGNTGKCHQTGKAEVRTKTEICRSIIRYHKEHMVIPRHRFSRILEYPPWFSCTLEHDKNLLMSCPKFIYFH